MSTDVSIIIPVYNDPQGIQTTIESLCDQTASNYEVIIVDNGSTDNTASVVRRYATNDSIRLASETEIQSSYAARNTGIDHATGNVLGFIDSDMWVEDNYVESIKTTVDDRESPYVGCHVEIIAGERSVERYNATTGFPIARYIKQDQFAPTCCLAVHRSVFNQVGKFDERLTSGGDLEFGKRVAAAGFKQVYEPEITLYHPARKRLRELIAKQRRVARGKEQLRRYHPNRFNHRSLVHPRNFAVSPWKFMKRIDGEAQSAFEAATWYGIEWGLKLYRWGVRVDERVRGKSE
jgi:glycosyltransferase involved in cell wall biosynthesis